MNDDLAKPTGTRGVAYLRVSNARQNKETQRDSIQRWLDLRGLAVGRWYADAGSRDLAYKREEFLQLLRDVEAGQIDWIVVDAKDRFGTANAWEFGKFVCQLRENDCQLWAVLQGHVTGDDVATDILSAVDSIRSRDEQIARSQRALRGKIPAARKGEWQGGYPPFGFDLACFGPDGREKWRVVYEGHFRRLKVYPDGRPPERSDGRDQMPAHDKGDVMRLVPSQDETRVDTVRRVFRWFATEAISKRGIAERLNAAGVRPIFSDRGWYSPLIAKMLRNPVYATGAPTWNKCGRGRFLEFVDGEYREVGRVRGRVRQGRRRAPTDFVPADHAGQGLVDRETFDLVQAKLDGAPEYRRAPRNPRLWLAAGLLVCGHCGRPMSGWYRRHKAVTDTYVCSTYNTFGPNNPAGCRLHMVTSPVLESLIGRYLQRAGQTLDELLDRDDDAGFLVECDRQITRAEQDYLREIQRTWIELRRTGALPPPCAPRAYPSLVAAYDRLHSADPDRLAADLADKEAELARLVEQFARLTNKVAVEQANRKMDAIGQEIEELRDAVRPRTAPLRILREELDHARGRLREAQARLAEDAPRRKAQALRRIVSRIECRFRHFDAGSRRRSQLEAVVIHPLDGPASPEVAEETPPGRGFGSGRPWWSARCCP